MGGQVKGDAGREVSGDNCAFDIMSPNLRGGKSVETIVHLISCPRISSLRS